MAATSLVISILALIVAYLAFRKSGGSVEEMTRKVEDLGMNMETLRMKTAAILESIEKKLRGEEKKPPEDRPQDRDDSQQQAAA